MKHNYLMSFHQDDWNDLQVIRKITDTPVSQLLREGLRNIVKSRKEDISQRRKMRETLSHMDAVWVYGNPLWEVFLNPILQKLILVMRNWVIRTD